MNDPIVARLIANLISGFQAQVIALEKDGMLLGQFLHHERKLRWEFATANPDNPDQGGAFTVEMRVIPADEIADEIGDSFQSLLRTVSHDWDKEPFVWVEDREK